MFGNMFDIEGYIEKFKPHAQDAANSISAYAERVISRLDTIAESVQESESVLERHVVVRFSPTAELMHNIELPGFSPNGEDWKIESVTVRSSGATGQFAIFDYLAKGPFDIPMTGVAIWAATTTTPNNSITHDGKNVRIPAGSGITVLNTGDTWFRIVLTRERSKPKYKGVSGQYQQIPNADNDSNDDTRRHLGPGRDMMGVNVIGERHG